MKHFYQPWPIVILLSMLAVGWLTYADSESPLRFWLTTWFMFVCPGMAWVRLLRLPESYVEWTLGIALSLALDAIVAGVMLYAGVWSPTGGLTALLGLSLAGVAAGQMIAVYRPRPQQTQ